MTLMNLTYQLFGVTFDLEMIIQARRIPGHLNRMGDLLSCRHQVVNTGVDAKTDWWHLSSGLCGGSQ